MWHGAILEQLDPRYELTGLDLSQEMLEVARQKVPQARLFCDDMTRFDLGGASTSCSASSTRSTTS